MRIKKYTLKFIGGKDNKVYLRYFATIEKGVGKTYDKPIDAKLQKEDLGLIDVLDHASYVAVKRDKIDQLLQFILNTPIKKQKVKIEVAR